MSAEPLNENTVISLINLTQNKLDRQKKAVAITEQQLSIYNDKLATLRKAPVK